MNQLPRATKIFLKRYAKRLKKEGYSLRQIAEIMGYKNHNSITHLLKDKS